MATKTLMTVEEFAQMTVPETEDYELVDGELVALSSGTPLHAKIRQNVEWLLRNYFAGKQLGLLLGEVDCRVSNNTVRRPDVSIFLGTRLREIDSAAIPIPFAPDIAVEVLSPSEKAIDVHRKVRDYLEAGSKEVWILDHENGEIFLHTAGQIRLLPAADTLETTLLPGFKAPVRELLAGF